VPEPVRIGSARPEPSPEVFQAIRTMSSMPQPPQRLTREQYLERERLAETRSEFHDGQVVAMAGATRAHVRIVSNLVARLDEQLRDRPCDVYSSDLRVSIESGRRYVYPDMIVTCGDEAFENDQTLLNPVVVIEVLSPSTELYDRNTKFLAYQTIGSLREYVLISTSMRRIEVYRRGAGNAWEYESCPVSPSPVALRSIECVLGLDEVYSRVDVPALPPEIKDDRERERG
jgi:Uma2 family endonuclease